MLLDLNHDAGSRADVIVDPPVAPHIDSSEVPTGHDGNNREAGSSGENVLKNTNHGLGSSSDIMEAFYDIDANRQATHEKLPYLTAPLSDPASSTEDSESANSVNGERAHYRDMMSSSWRKFRDASAKWSNRQIQRWIRRVRGEQIEEWEEGVDEDTPLEELSGAARRRRIKLDIRRLGVVEDGELRSVYRPRKRMG